MHENIFKILNILVNDGHSTGQLDKKITQSDLYLIVVINTIQFINQRFKSLQNEAKLSKEDENHLIYITNKILEEPRK